jgi:hypothetical protein
MNVLGLAIVFTSGYLAGVAISDETSGHALDSTPAGTVAAAWTVRTPTPARADAQRRAARPPAAGASAISSGGSSVVSPSLPC